MIFKALPLAALLLAGAPAALAQGAGQAVELPALTRTLTWQPGQDIALGVPPEGGVTVQFESGEQIASVVIEQPARLTVDAPLGGERLRLIAQAQGPLGIIEVSTDRRFYRFQLRSGGEADPKFAQIAYPATQGLAAVAASEVAAGDEISDYRTKGDAVALPQQVSHDGMRTYISFAEDASLPAVFGIGPTGEEELLNSYFRDGRLVVDSVVDRLVFRIDKAMATAERGPAKGRRNGR